jgi:hypothetical protein
VAAPLLPTLALINGVVVAAALLSLFLLVLELWVRSVLCTVRVLWVAFIVRTLDGNLFLHLRKVQQSLGVNIV